jgi:hypothetical protein
MPCEICDSIGPKREADHDEGQHLPEEYRRLVVIDEDPHTFDILKCPECGTFYTYEYRVDNDIYDSIHVSILKRTSAESAHRLIRMGAQYDEKRRKSLLRKVTPKYGPTWKRLTKDEERVIDHLIRRSWAGGGNHPKAMEVSLDMSREALEAILKRLEERHLIVRSVSLPSQPEPGIDVRDYTHLKINPDV